MNKKSTCVWERRGASFVDKKSTVIDVDFLSTNDAPQHSQKQIFGFHVDFVSTNDAQRYTRFVGFLSTIYR